MCKSFKEPRNQFPAWQAGTTTLLVVPARQAAQAGAIDSSESIHGLHERLQIRAHAGMEKVSRIWRAMHCRLCINCYGTG